MRIEIISEVFTAPNEKDIFNTHLLLMITSILAKREGAYL